MARHNGHHLDVEVVNNAFVVVHRRDCPSPGIYDEKRQRVCTSCGFKPEVRTLVKAH